ncbi:MAG TPA: HlyD family efflux transporter periplasmic adaptor subunit [Chlorobaculum sp.]|jgi:protease secretion system membrane fusion protein|nr:HlyD family efflux transporter periplasmic adaptor subunit [Chlorobaculum sp.]
MKPFDVQNWLKSLFPPKGAYEPGKLQTDTRGPIRLGIWVLIIGFGGFLLWFAVAPLDEGVPCQGAVCIATKRKIVQHRQGGVVAEVRVHEGQLVKKGDVLLRLDSQTSKARYEEIHQHYLGLRASEDRLNAELRGAGKIEFHQDLVDDPNRTLVEQLMKNQLLLLGQRVKTMRLYQSQLAGLSDLVREGYAPLSQQRDLEIKIAQLKTESATQLAQIQNEIQADAEKSKALAEELAETEIRAPESGQIVGLQVQSVGAVIQPGQKIMDVVPLDEALLIEVKVAPHLIDKVHAGLVASVQFASFAHTPQLVIPGKVESVSKDLLTDQQGAMQPAQSYYLARVSVTPQGMKDLGTNKMQPGMPAQVIIKTGERSMLNYLLHPLAQRLSASMKEE